MQRDSFGTEQSVEDLEELLIEESEGRSVCPVCGWSIHAYGCYVGQCRDPQKKRLERKST